MVAPTPHLVPMTNVLALPAGSVLAGDYKIDRVLGAGGFGITYLARDLVLDRAVTIKEYFPVDFAARGGSNDAVPRSQDSAADYQWGLDRFIEEAKILAQFDHRNIVKVFRYFQENCTAYMVLQFEEGRSLKAWQKALGRSPRQGEIDAIVAPLLDALAFIHDADFLHRDIAPDNIIVRTDGSPVLIDFGSARGDIARHSRTVSALVKPGYSPYEQYAETGNQQGPWTDIYALGATLYHVVTGRRPPDSPSRIVKDEYVTARDTARGAYRARFLGGIDHALALDIKLRPRSVAEWRGELLAPDDDARKGLFWRKPTSKPEVVLKSTVRLPEPEKIPVQQREVPPPPDAPGKHGGFIDFLDGLRKKSTPQQEQKPPAGKPRRLSDALAEAKAPDSKPAQAMQAQRDKPDPIVAPAIKPAAKISKARRRPRAVRSPGSWRWRPVALKLLAGAVIAGLAVHYQDQLSRWAPQRSATVPRAAMQPLLPAPVLAHSGGASAVVFSQNGREVVSAGLDTTVKIWNGSSGRLVRSIGLDNGPATSIDVRDDRLLTGHSNGVMALWDLSSGKKLGEFKYNEAAVWSVAFAGNTSKLIAGYHDWKIRLWDTASPGAPMHVLDDHANAVQAVRYTGEGTRLVSGGADKTVKLWNLANLDLVRTYRGHKDFVTAVAISPDAKRIAGANLRGGIRLWSAQSNRLLRNFGRHTDRVTGLAFSPSGTMLASSSADGTIRLWHVSSQRPVRAYAAGASVNTVVFAPDGRSLVAATADGRLHFWATGRGRSDDGDDG